MSNNHTITHESASAEQIAVIVDVIEDALIEIEAPKSHALMACLAIAIGIMKPSVSGEELANGVEHLSNVLVTMLLPTESNAVN